MQQLEGVPSSQTLGWTAWVHARMGNSAEARKILQQLLSERAYVPPGIVGAVYMGLGDADGTFRYWEMAREQQLPSLSFARVESLWGPFRSDPRYLTLLTEIGLSDEQIQKNQRQQ
jgi:hypothetical protein